MGRKDGSVNDSTQYGSVTDSNKDYGNLLTVESMLKLKLMEEKNRTMQAMKERTDMAVLLDGVEKDRDMWKKLATELNKTLTVLLDTNPQTRD